MEDLLQKAKELGETVAAHAKCEALKSALDALKGDAEATKLEQDYAAAARVLQDKTAAGQPLEPEDKRKEADLRAQMAKNQVIRDFLRAQADFSDMMRETNEALEKAIGLG